MSLFKQYIETAGSEDPVLSQTSEFVTYYALPYVPNPLEHKSFKHLFTREFSQSLKQKIENYVDTYYKAH
jgi:LisH domain-containing protein ARMC9